MPVAALQSGKGKHITRASKRRIEPMLAMSGVVAAYPCFVKARRLEEHARRYLLHDTLVIRWGMHAVVASPCPEPYLRNDAAYRGYRWELANSVVLRGTKMK